MNYIKSKIKDLWNWFVETPLVQGAISIYQVTVTILKWSFVTFTVASMALMVATIFNYDIPLLPQQADADLNASSSYQIDMSGVDDREAFSQKMELYAERLRLDEKRAEVEEQTKELNAREESLE